MSETSDVLVDIRKVIKRYPGVTALDRVDFTVRKGETHALVGENGAGKTTLVHILCGGTLADEYESFHYNGSTVKISSPQDAINLGISAIQQNFSLVEEMTVAGNIFLGNEFLTRRGTVDDKKMNEQAEKLLKDMGLDIKPYIKVGKLSASNQQVVEICKAISQNPTMLIMDEPTSGLAQDEIKKLFSLIKRLHEHGITVLYISHRLEEIFEVADRVTVLRNGKNVLESSMKNLDMDELTKAIVGQELSRRYPKEKAQIGKKILEIKNLSNDQTKPILKDISFDVHEGEIFAVYGILGSGKDQLSDTIFGRYPATSGKIFAGGKEVTIRTPHDAIDCGLGYLTTDRHRDGLMTILSLMYNLTLPSLEKKFSSFAKLLEDKEIEASDEFRQRLELHTPNVYVPVLKLSGGNQQKVVIGKWLLADSRILIMNEPTKGVDIGSKAQIFKLLVEQVKKGSSVILLTNELEEAVEMGDRILIMRNGHAMKIVDHQDIKSGKITSDEILRLATQREKSESPVN